MTGKADLFFFHFRGKSKALRILRGIVPGEACNLLKRKECWNRGET